VIASKSRESKELHTKTDTAVPLYVSKTRGNGYRWAKNRITKTELKLSQNTYTQTEH
jgi:hypothetical protein